MPLLDKKGREQRECSFERRRVGSSENAPTRVFQWAKKGREQRGYFNKPWKVKSNENAQVSSERKGAARVLYWAITVREQRECFSLLGNVGSSVEHHHCWIWAAWYGQSICGKNQCRKKFRGRHHGKACYSDLRSTDKRNTIKERCKFDDIISHFIFKFYSASNFIDFGSSNLEVMVLSFSITKEFMRTSWKISYSKACMSPTGISGCSRGPEPTPKAREDGRLHTKSIGYHVRRVLSGQSSDGLSRSVELVSASWFSERGNSQ